jgi:hypothetical protein
MAGGELTGQNARLPAKSITRSGNYAGCRTIFDFFMTFFLVIF